VRGTLRAIQQDLTVDDTFVLRYRNGDEGVDGLPGDEGAFLACSFWLADALILDGQVEAGEALFERLLALRNDVGLLAEEYDPRIGRQLGNVPQAYSHVALVNTALNLASAQGGRVGPAAERADAAAGGSALTG
jgi:GH15 family glucan-1,4-alpha-glucosidase